MKEYIKLHWDHMCEKEDDDPIIMLYEVDLDEDRYATRLMEIFSDCHVECIEDKDWRFVTEGPVPTVDEINSGEYGEEFHASLVTEYEFTQIWDSHMYHGALSYGQE